MAAGMAAQQRESPSAFFDKFRTFLWLKGGPDLDPSFAKALAEAGVDGTNVAGTASKTQQHSLRLPFYVDHVAGKGPLFLSEKKWTESLESWLKTREGPLPARPDCLADPEVMQRAQERIQKVLRAQGVTKNSGRRASLKAKRPGHTPTPNPYQGAQALSLDDEISLTRRNRPLDYCHSPATLERFRRWLKLQYPTHHDLNRKWNTRFSSFGEVHPMGTDEIRQREFSRAPSRWNLAPWSDHREFMDTQLSDFVRALAAKVKEFAPHLPVGFTGGEAPSPFSGVDWALLLPQVDFVEPYDSAGTRELVRSFAKPKTLIMQTLFLERDSIELLRWRLWAGMLRGDRGAIIWSAETFFESSASTRLSPKAKALAATLRAMKSPAARAWMAAQTPSPRIAVVESQPSNRLHWMLDSRADGGSWWRRFGSYEALHGSQNRTREAWQRLLEDLGFEYRHIDARALARSGSLSGYDVLILPQTLALSDAAATTIRAFGANKLVIADHHVARFDEHLRAHPRGRLDQEFGIAEPPPLLKLADISISRSSLSSRFRPNPNASAVKALLPANQRLKLSADARASAWVGKAAIIIERDQEKGGKFVYLNLNFAHLLEERRDKQDALRNHLRRLFRSAGVRPKVRIRSSELPVRLFQRQDQEGELLALLPNRHRQQYLNRAAATSTRSTQLAEVRLTFPRPVVLIELKGERLPVVPIAAPLDGKQKSRRRWSLSLAPDVGRVFRVR